MTDFAHSPLRSARPRSRSEVPNVRERAEETAMAHDRTRKELRNPGYEIFIGSLSTLSILNLVLLYAVADPNLDTVITALNWLFSAVFLADFTYRLFTAESKTRYFFPQFGWADLLASLPLPQAKILRVFRLVRVYRLLRHDGIKPVVRSMRTERA